MSRYSLFGVYDAVQIQRKHNLAVLFKMLHNNIKKEIIGPENEEIFMEKLENISDVSEKWRYIK